MHAERCGAANAACDEEDWGIYTGPPGSLICDGDAHWYPDRRVRVSWQDREQLVVRVESKIFIVVALNDDARLIVIAIDEVQAAGMAGGADANEAGVRGGRRRRGGCCQITRPAGG